MDEKSSIFYFVWRITICEEVTPMDKELQKTTLHVAIISNTWMTTEYYYRKFLEDNKDNIIWFSKDRAVLNDGTIVDKIPLSLGNKLKGMRIDQVLLCLYKDVDTEEIRYVMDLLHESQVPQSYWFMCYEEDERWR